MNRLMVDQFFVYARLRQSILLAKRAGKPAPWTSDPVFQDTYFCNIFREDDKTTVWFRENVRSQVPLSQVLQATVCFRWFNRIETGRLIKEELLEPVWHRARVEAKLRHSTPVVTGAYLIKTPDRMDKLTGVLWAIDKFLAQHLTEVNDYLGHVKGMYRVGSGWTFPQNQTLQHTHELLMKAPYLGSFMAYEIVTDLANTPLLMHAPDKNTWAAAGPGAARGLDRLLGDGHQYNYHSKPQQGEMCLAMQELLRDANHTSYWPKDWPRWDMRTVEHTLCEFDKYERVRLGQGRSKRRYSPRKTST